MRWLEQEDFVNKKTKKTVKPKSKSKSKSTKSIAEITKEGQEASRATTKKVKRHLSRKVFSNEKTVHGKPSWRAIRRGVIDEKVYGKAFVKDTIYLKRDEEYIRGEGVVKLGKGEPLRGEGGEATIKREVTIDPYWRDEYSDAVIRNDSDIEIDHIVPVDRAKKSGRFRTSKDAQAFYTHVNNLAITEKKTNQAKGNLLLGQINSISHGKLLRNPATNPKAQLSPKKYAKRYGDVMKHFGMIMTHGEADEFKRLTGKEFTGGKQHMAQDVHGQSIADSQEQYDFMLARKKK